MNRRLQFDKIGGRDILHFVPARVALPKAGEAQMVVKAAGLNRAELLFIGGEYLINPVLPPGVRGKATGDSIAVRPDVAGFAGSDRVAITPALNQLSCTVLGDGLKRGDYKSVIERGEDRRSATSLLKKPPRTPMR